LGVLLLTALPGFRAEALTANSPAPEFSLQSLEGAQTTLTDYRGKYLLLNFWATWCGPCKIEMPSLEYLHRKFKSKNLNVVAVSNDMFGSRVVKPYIQAQNLTFPVLLDPQATASKLYGVNSLPTTFLIDPQGTIIGILNGAENWAEPETVLYFENLLSAP